MSHDVIELTGQTMCWQDIEWVARHSTRIELSPEVTQRIASARHAVEMMAVSGTPYYGINTGLGALCHIVLPPEQLTELSWHTLMSHSCGVGEDLATDQVRAIMFCAVINFSQGCSGISPWIVDALVHFLNCDVIPVVPARGSVGYLSHMAHIGLALIGEGDVIFHGSRSSARNIFNAIDYSPGVLAAKDGLSLVNGTPAMTGLACLNLADAYRLGLWADVVGAMSFEALSGQLDALDPWVLQRKAQPNVRKVGERIRQLVADSPYLAMQKGEHLQDALSLRSMPQVHGACWEQWEYAVKQIEAELNSATDNPLVVAEGDHYRVVSQANPHGEAVAMACDTLAIAVCEWSSISERRSYRLVTPQASTLPSFLIKDSGVKSGMMIAQYSAASLAAENKRLAQPCVTDNFMTSGLQEDHLSFGEASALKLAAALSNGFSVLAIEYLLAGQALDLIEGQTFGSGTQRAWRMLRQNIAMYDECHSLHIDIRKATELLREAMPTL